MKGSTATSPVQLDLFSEISHFSLSFTDAGLQIPTVAQDRGLLNLHYPSMHSQQYDVPRLKACEKLKVCTLH
jgi:hypothetical protein